MRVLPVCLSACLSTTCIPGAQGDDEALYGFWKSNPGPSDQVILTTEPTLQPIPFSFLK